MNANMQIGLGSGPTQLDARRALFTRAIPWAALEHGFQPSPLSHRRVIVDWLVVAVWTGMLSFVALFWVGILRFMMWSAR